MTNLISAIQTNPTKENLLKCRLPSHFRAAHVLASESKSLKHCANVNASETIHVGDIPLPTLEPDEVLLGVMASSINYNTVWSATFKPVSTFRFLSQLDASNSSAKKHNLNYQVIGSDASGIVIRKGSLVNNWDVGDNVVVHPNCDFSKNGRSHYDDVLSPDSRIWGYETNFGGLGDFATVKASQLLPKAKHLSWEESAIIPLCHSTAYRMLISENGANMKIGDVVLIWGATGGLGAFAVQLVRNAGGIPVGVVGTEEKVELAYSLGCAAVINRSQLGPKKADGLLSEKSWLKIKSEILRQVGEEPHIVFEYTGRETFSASVFLARNGGKIVTCGSTSGYTHEYDNRYLWMNAKSIIGSHCANNHEAQEANRLVCLGLLTPTISAVYSLDNAPEAARSMQLNQHTGKIAIRCLSPSEGSGIEDIKNRARLNHSLIKQFATS